MLASNTSEMTGQPFLSKREQTRSRLLACALDLFERQGYEATTVAQIAASAGVTEMTFFRHFSAKPGVVLDDPYDPVIAAAVAAQPRGMNPVRRTVAAIRVAWSELPEPDGESVRRRVRIVSETPSLRGAVWQNNAATERLIAGQLVADGADPLPAKAAAAAVLAAVAAALFEWADHDELDLPSAIAVALNTLDDLDG